MYCHLQQCRISAHTSVDDGSVPSLERGLPSSAPLEKALKGTMRNSHVIQLLRLQMSPSV